jgi:FtsP/CotA-like multicopper oxidase with cupredoxin domain
MLADIGKAGLLAALALAAAMPAAAQAPDNAAQIEEARRVIGGFAKSLLGELQGAMQKDGPVGAINVCNHAAPAIAAKAGDTSGWKVGRTALKLRNAKNAPDAWEKKVLDDFLAKSGQGADLAKLEHQEIVTEGGARTLRFMKAIPVGEPCLTCHGGDVKSEVKDAITKLYPNDTATGFKTGELRGAFTLSRKLN